MAAVITFRCSVCKQVLKIGADKAGRKAKCKCGADLTIPAASEPAAATPPPLPSGKPDDDDEGGTYGLIDVITTPTPVAEAKPKKTGDEEEDEEDDEGGEGKSALVIPEGAAQKRAKAPRARALLEPEKWLKVCLGLKIVSVGLWIWLGAALLREIPMLIGLFNRPEYARVRLRYDDPKTYTQLTGEGPADSIQLTKPEFMMALLTGDGVATAGLWLFRISAIFLMVAHLTLVTGYAFCLAVPPRFGTRGQALTLLILGVVNALFTLFFRLLPAFGTYDWTLIPVAVPEVALLDANLEREVPLSIQLSSLPMLEYLLSFLVMGTYLIEPVLIGSFLSSIALSMRYEPLREWGDGMVRLGLGTAFVTLAYMVLMVCGSSDVLTWLLRLVYLLGLGFFLGQLGWFAVVVMWTPPEIMKEIDVEEIDSEAAAVQRAALRYRGDEEEDEDDEDEDDEDED
jgi:hypothetical protein